DGAHWPEARIPASATAPTLAWRTAAVHSSEAAVRAERAGATAVVFGSVYEPGSKPGSAAGIEALREAVAATALPVYAIGGITPERVAGCIAAGASGVAVVSGVLGAQAPGTAIDGYLAALTSAAAEPAGIASTIPRGGSPH